MNEIYVDPVCPWCWRTAQWFFETANKNNDDFVIKPFSLFRKAVYDGNPPEEDSPTWLKLSRVIAGVIKDNPENAQLHKDTYWELATNWHENLLRDLPKNAEWEKYFDDESLDADLDEQIKSAISVTGSDLGVPIIINRSIEPNVGYFGPVIDNVPKGDEAQKLYESMTTLLNTQGVYEIKRMRTK
jgi:hypothetical protein